MSDTNLPVAPSPEEGVFTARRLEASQRRKRVAQVRMAIEANDYENELKLSIAADRILDALFGDDASDD